jgi:hypothetical protein
LTVVHAMDLTRDHGPIDAGASHIEVSRLNIDHLTDPSNYTVHGKDSCLVEIWEHRGLADCRYHAADCSSDYLACDGYDTQAEAESHHIDERAIRGPNCNISETKDIRVAEEWGIEARTRSSVTDPGDTLGSYLKSDPYRRALTQMKSMSFGKFAREASELLEGSYMKRCEEDVSRGRSLYRWDQCKRQFTLDTVVRRGRTSNGSLMLSVLPGPRESVLAE